MNWQGKSLVLHAGPSKAALIRVAVLSLILALVLSACAGVGKLRQAQTSFNEAAAADDQSRLAAYTSGEAADVGTLAVRASAGYAMAVAIVRGLSDREKATLSSDGLLGDAQTIEAMSLWRLRDYRQAMQVAKGIQSKALYPRDAALIAALPGLIEISEAYDKIYLQDPHPEKALEEQGKKECLFSGHPAGLKSDFKSFDQVDQLLNDAIAHIEAARRNVGPRDPISDYLLQAELSAYKNKMDAIYYGCTKSTLSPDKKHLTDAEIKAAQAILNDYYCAVQPNPSQPRPIPVVAFWAMIIGLQEPNGCPIH